MEYTKKDTYRKRGRKNKRDKIEKKTVIEVTNWSSQFLSHISYKKFKNQDYNQKSTLSKELKILLDKFFT
jgi:hypothetical protein